MNDRLAFGSWSMTIQKPRHILKAREKILSAAEKADFPEGDRVLLTMAALDIFKIFLNHFPEFDLSVKPEGRPSQKGVSIKIQLPETLLNSTVDSDSLKNDLLDILKKDIKRITVIFDELIPAPEKGTAPSLTLIKWDYSCLNPR